MTIKFGIIGCSRNAERSVIPAINKSQHAELQYIGSNSISKAKEFAKKFHCKKYGNYENVISDPDIDAVYISTPIGLHEDWILKSISAGKHVYCEKSITTSFESAKRIIHHARENNVRVLEGFMFKFHPQHMKVKEIIHQNRIGNPVSFSGIFGFPAFPLNDIRYNKSLGGGFLNDSGCYPISASRMIFNEEPIGVSCSLLYDGKTDVDVGGTSYLIFEKDKTASIVYGNGNYYQAGYSVWGSQGILSLDRAYSVPPDFSPMIKLKYSSDFTWEGRKNEIFKIEPANHFLIMLDTFCLDIANKTKSPFNFEEDILNQARVMDAHRISSSEKRFVYLDELK